MIVAVLCTGKKVLSTTDIGRYGEDMAAQFLHNSGYEILERNWHFPQGEIDIIALLDDTLVFVEVKTRTGENHGTPEESVIPAKQKRLMLGAGQYVGELELDDVGWRLDIIAVRLAPGGKVYSIQHHQDAFYFDV